MREARSRGCDLIVFTECALTAFFPHWWIDDEAELDTWFEAEMPGRTTKILFVEAGVKHRFNTSVLVAADGRIVGKYRKIHLPGYADRHPQHPFQNLEKRYF